MEPYKILFIGNSHTYYNDMPRMVVKLAEAAGHERNLETEQSTGNGVSLEWHWKNSHTRDLIKDEKWNFVILQERSGGPLEAMESMHRHARLLDTEIKKQAGKTIFYMTWAGKRRPETQKIITDAYKQIAKELDAILAPVGVAWENCQKKNSDINLFHKDGRHANPMGSYLAACVFYTLLYSVSPEGLPIPIFSEENGLKNLPEDQIRFLQKMAFEAVQEKILSRNT